MLILAKAAMALLLGFILAIITGVILIPILRRFHIGQYVSHYIGERHLKKRGNSDDGGINIYHTYHSCSYFTLF